MWPQILLWFVLFWMCCPFFVNPDSMVHGANMGPTLGRQDPGGPHIGHMNLAIWEFLKSIWPYRPRSLMAIGKLNNCRVTSEQLNKIACYLTTTKQNNRQTMDMFLWWIIITKSLKMCHFWLIPFFKLRRDYGSLILPKTKFGVMS